MTCMMLPVFHHSNNYIYLQLLRNVYITETHHRSKLAGQGNDLLLALIPAERLANLQVSFFKLQAQSRQMCILSAT